MPPTYNGGSPVTGYRIEWDNGTGFWSVHTASKTDSSLTVTGLVAGTSYLFKVAAINSIGTSAFSNNFRITAAFVPDPPAALTIDYALTNGT
jgi:titin